MAGRGRFGYDRDMTAERHLERLPRRRDPLGLARADRRRGRARPACRSSCWRRSPTTRRPTTSASTSSAPRTTSSGTTTRAPASTPVRTQTLLRRADVVVVRFGEQYKQWNAAFDAGFAAALGKPLDHAPPARARPRAEGDRPRRDGDRRDARAGGRDPPLRDRQGVAAPTDLGLVSSDRARVLVRHGSITTPDHHRNRAGDPRALRAGNPCIVIGLVLLMWPRLTSGPPASRV